MSELFSSLNNLQCGDQFIICIDEFNNIWSFGSNENFGFKKLKKKKVLSPKQIKTLTNIQFISCGLNYSLFCDYNGYVFSFGNNDYGQLGLNKSSKQLPYSFIPNRINIPPIKQISCGLYFSICLSKDGELWSFGENYHGELGVGDTEHSSKPLKIYDLSNIDYIICGGYFSYCKTISNQYYSWGYNNYGQLAQGNTNNIIIPTLCDNLPNDIVSIKGGSCYILFLTSNGIVYSCGDNRFGQLGHANNINLSIPQEIISLPIIKKISCGYHHSLCIDINYNLWVFGNNKQGQLGLGHYNNIDIPIKHNLLENIIDLSYKSNSTIVKTLDNKIYSFGDNFNVQFDINNIEKICNNNKPIQVLIDKEDIWKTNISQNIKKSARK